MVSCTPKVALISTVVFGVLFVLSLVFDFKIFPDIIKDQVNKATRLDEGTEQWDRFVELPFPLKFQMYIFNITNPEKILQNEKPIVEELGPWVYDQWRNKTIIGFGSDDTVIYTQTEYFYFNGWLSNGLTDDQEVTIINPVKTSILQIIEDLQFLPLDLVDQCMHYIFPDEKTRDMFITVKIRNLALDGINFCTPLKEEDIDPNEKFCYVIQMAVCTLAATKRNIDIVEADNSLIFSLFKYKDHKDDGIYTIKRGIADITTLGHIVKWNNASYTDYWREESECSEVKGTDSTLYPPRVDKDETFFVYATDICRHVEIKYYGEDEYKGIKGYLFGTDETTLQSSTENPEDDCYCSHLTKGLDGKPSCFLDGAIDMYTCTKVPVLFSFPHFLWADHYRSLIDGVNPDENIHQTYLLVEPNTGTPLKGSKKIQLNFILRKINGIKELEQVETGRLVPLVWIDEGIFLNDDYIDMLNDLYFSKVKLVEGVKWTLTAVTAFLTLVLGYTYYRKRKNATKTV